MTTINRLCVGLVHAVKKCFCKRDPIKTKFLTEMKQLNLGIKLESESLVFQYYKQAVHQFENKLQSTTNLYDHIMLCVAYNYLGHCYLKGFGTPVNLEAAFLCFQKGSKPFENHKHDVCVLSLINLGLCYLHGMGVDQDQTKAFDLFLQSTEYEICSSQINTTFQFQWGYPLYLIACCYLRGTGVEENEDNALQYLHMAIEKNYSKATVLYELLEEKRKLKDAMNLLDGISNTLKSNEYLSFCLVLKNYFTRIDEQCKTL
jgi:TPR repeat protein